MHYNGVTEYRRCALRRSFPISALQQNVPNIPEILSATSKFQASEGRHETRSVLSAQKYQATPSKCGHGDLALGICTLVRVLLHSADQTPLTDHMYMRSSVLPQSANVSLSLQGIAYQDIIDARGLLIGILLTQTR